MVTKSTKHEQTNKPRIFLKRKIFRLKKTGPGQIRTQDLCHPSQPKRIRCINNKRTEDASKFQFIMHRYHEILLNKLLKRKKSIFVFDNAS